MNNKNLTLTNLYIPPGLTVADFPDLQLATLLSHTAPSILMGDFNCHHPLWNGRVYHGGATIIYLSQAFNHDVVIPPGPTFIPFAYILDLFLINGMANLRTRGLQEGLSNHYPVLLMSDVMATITSRGASPHLSAEEAGCPPRQLASNSSSCW